MKRKILSLVLCAMLFLGVFPLSAHAEGEKATRTTPIDLSADGAERVDKLDTEGWKWEPSADGGTLTLRNLNLQVDTMPAVIFPENGGAVNLKIRLEGKNTVAVNADYLAPIFRNSSGTSIMNTTIENGDAEGSLDIKTPETHVTEYGAHPYCFPGETLTLKSGTVTTNAGLCIVSKAVNIEGGSLSINLRNINDNGIYSNSGPVNFSGGTVNIEAGGVCVFVAGVNTDAEQAVNITGGKVTLNNSQSTSTGIGLGIYAHKVTVNTSDDLRILSSYVPIFLSGKDSSCAIEHVGNVIELKSDQTASKPTFPMIYGKKENNPTITIAKADYSAVDEALAAVPADLSIYTDETVRALNTVRDGINRNLDALHQPEVAAYVGKINDAVANLEIKPADYSAVDAALAKIPADLTLYTDESVAKLKEAEEAVVRGKDITEQTTVTAYATAIEDAIKALVFKPADYSAVDEALAKIPADLSGYTDESVAKLKEAENAVVRGKNISEQKTVTAYATAIEDAISKLVLKKDSPVTLPVKDEKGNVVATVIANEAIVEKSWVFHCEPLGSKKYSTKTLDTEAYDLYFTDAQGARVEPKSAVKVRLAIPERFLDAKELQFFHVENGKNVKVSFERKDSYVFFEAKDFSPFFFGRLVEAKPVKPEPAKPVKPANPAKPSAPKTGDPGVALSCMTLIGSAAAAVAIQRKKRDR